MEDMEQKIGSILNNPQMMQQIMSMAQSLGQQQPAQQQQTPSPPPQEEAPAPSPLGADIDPAAIQKIIGLASQTGIDRNEQALLKALRPYLTNQRIVKLEKAMRAAKLAKVASSALNSGAISFLSGR